MIREMKVRSYFTEYVEWRRPNPAELDVGPPFVELKWSRPLAWLN